MADDDDLPIFRPKFGKRDRANNGDRFPSFRNAVLASARGVASRSRGTRPTMGRARIAVRPSTAASRRVIVKVHVAPLRAGGAKAAALHLRYIERDGVEKDGTAGVLYGAEGAVAAKAFEAPRLQEQHQFRLIVSPEDARELDLSLYVRRFMARVEKDLGQRLVWAAVNHFDTDHPHAHIVVRGVDRDGREVRMPRAYVARGLRDRAQGIATEELGPRPERDLARQRYREVELDGLTTLDRQIEKRAIGERIEVRRDRQGPAGENESLLAARLRHLEVLRLTEKAAPFSWQLMPGWQQQLRDLGMRRDIIKQMHRALHGDLSRYRILTADASGDADGVSHSPVLYGRVVKKGLSDELRGSVFAVVESPYGGGYHVPLDKGSAEEIREGDFVAVQTRAQPWRRREDEEIQRIAHAHQGVYETPISHKASESQVGDVRQILHIDNQPRPSYRPGSSRGAMRLDEIAQGHTRRLVELEKLGLATRTADGSWRVDQNLLEKLDARDKEKPRRRFVVSRSPMALAEQVRHPGPVWLDRLRVEELARSGLGVELQKALAEREAVLRKHGIDPRDPERHRALSELERQILSSRIAKETGARPVENMPPDFRGRVRIHSADKGALYAEIRNGDRFALVPATLEFRALAGQTVTLSRDSDGRIHMRRLSRDRDRGDS